MAYILVIDDDKKIREMVRDLLEDAGHEVVGAPNGKIGLELQRQAPADLIITDIFMPEKGGTELSMDINDEYAQSKSIAISGGGNVKDGDFLQLAHNLGAIKTFQKPFVLKEFKAAVEEILQ